MKIYTKKGDTGTTSLIGGERVFKDDARVAAYGTVDELSAYLAFLRDSMAAYPQFDDLKADLRQILNTLMTVEALLAVGGGETGKVRDITNDQISFLEERIDRIGSELKPIDRFTIPGGHILVSLSHICRTVCRRAERAAVKAAREFEISANAVAYLNRLSDYLYQIGRRIGEVLKIEEEYWEP